MDLVHDLLLHSSWIQNIGRRPVGALKLNPLVFVYTCIVFPCHWSTSLSHTIRWRKLCAESPAFTNEPSRTLQIELLWAKFWGLRAIFWGRINGPFRIRSRPLKITDVVLEESWDRQRQWLCLCPQLVVSNLPENGNLARSLLLLPRKHSSTSHYYKSSVCPNLDSFYSYYWLHLLLRQVLTRRSRLPSYRLCQFSLVQFLCPETLQGFAVERYHECPRTFSFEEHLPEDATPYNPCHKTRVRLPLTGCHLKLWVLEMPSWTVSRLQVVMRKG